MKKPHTINGVHIQWPWSEMIVSGLKTVETRGYPLPEKYLMQSLAIIETPGPNGKKNGVSSARIIGVVQFGKCYKYKNRRAWSKEQHKHMVSKNDPQFSYQEDKPKWAWEVFKVRKITTPQPPPKRRGIIFATGCSVVY